MTLIDEFRAKELLKALADNQQTMSSLHEVAGGSAANTMAGLASLGGNGLFLGKVSDDRLGKVFGDSMAATGIKFHNGSSKASASTASSMIAVTPDGQRSMNTYLGASQALGPEHVEPALIEAAGIVYLEGYLWDPPEAKDAFRKAMTIAREAGRKVAFTLSDAFCVARYRAEFQALINEGQIDILFANEHEILSLCEVERFEDVLPKMRGKVPVMALTRSEKGSVVMRGGEMEIIAPEPIAKVVDSTGAGDLYAAGFLFGLARGRDLKTCGRLGSLCAAETLAHMGPRPAASLAKLAASRGL
jgi:sugar/nucleoside kinase (ribokinase family)